MADESNNITATGEGVKAKATKKQKSPKREKAIVETAPAASRAASVKTPGTPRKTYSERERAEKLTLIGTQVAQGKATLQEAIKTAGISVPAYYQWKRNETPVAKKVVKHVSGGHELAELVQLDAENQQLRKLLAEKLRAENVELRKRLGLDQTA